MVIDVPGASGPGAGAGAADTVLLYGHLDKQPEMMGWTEGYGPWMPRLEGDKLYGRGGADDGYAMFGALSALLALREQRVAHTRCVILIEACEESGSPDLPYYVDHLAARLGSPSLVVCLDSGCGNYERLWLTTSLRGMTAGTLEVRVLDEGVHSGDASGVVPSSFRIMRQLLSRLEDEMTGAVQPSEFYAQIPPERVMQARRAAASLGDAVYTKFPFAPGMTPVTDDRTELVLNRTWRPQLAVIGIDGLPRPGDAGNVLLPLGSLARLYGRRRQHPVHGDARRKIPAGAVRRHRRARSAFQRARTQRIPAHPDRQAGHDRDRPGAGGPLRPARGKIGRTFPAVFEITRRFRRVWARSKPPIGNSLSGPKASTRGLNGP